MKAALQRALLATVVLAQSASCGESPLPADTPGLQFKVGEIRLRLEERDGSCQAIASNGKGTISPYSLDIPWPCRFHGDPSGAIRTIHEGGYAYVLVESSNRNPPPSRDCETRLRSIRIKGAGVAISPHRERVASCPPFQWDALLFRELFD